MDIKKINNMVLEGNILNIDNDIVNLYVNIYNINEYRYYINNLSDNNSYLKDIIEKKRKKLYDKLVSLIDANGLLPEFSDIYNSINDNRGLEDYLKKLQVDSDNYFYLMLIDRYFEDIPYNFLINLNMILEFTESISDNIIDENRLKLYYLISNFNFLDIEKKKSVYNYMNNGIDYVSLFYDDYRNCKNYAYSLYNKTVINPNNFSDFAIYELNGENFTAIVHQTDFFRDNKEIRDNLWRDKCYDNTTISFSIIDQDHFDTIFYDTCVIFGFNDLDINRIMHVYHSDSMSEKCNGSHRINDIYNIDNLMKLTSTYNELLYVESNEMIRESCSDSLMPTYILCYDNIYPVEKLIAKEYNIPIVVVNTAKYKKRVRNTPDFNPNNYICYEDELYDMNLKRNR